MLYSCGSSPLEAFSQKDTLGWAYRQACVTHIFPPSVLIFLLGKQVGKKIFFTNGVKMTFEEVKALCTQFQGSVATPTNAEENQAILDVAKGEAFLGITDLETEGHFVDLTGQSVTYQNWNDGEPNDAASGEDCVMNLTSNGKWNDIACSASLLAVCEVSI